MWVQENFWCETFFNKFRFLIYLLNSEKILEWKTPDWFFVISNCSEVGKSISLLASGFLHLRFVQKCSRSNKSIQLFPEALSCDLLPSLVVMVWFYFCCGRSLKFPWTRRQRFIWGVGKCCHKLKLKTSRLNREVLCWCRLDVTSAQPFVQIKFRDIFNLQSKGNSSLFPLKAFLVFAFFSFSQPLSTRWENRSTRLLS